MSGLPFALTVYDATGLVKTSSSGSVPTHTHADGSTGGQLTDAALSAAVGITKGGTGQTTQTAAFDALAPTTTKGDLIVSNGTDNIRLAVGTDGYALIADSAQAAGAKWDKAIKVARLWDSKAQGTAGGSMAATTWTNRDLNTENDPDSIVSISSNLFTPVAGTYEITVTAPFICSSTPLIALRLYNDTQASVPTGGYSAVDRGQASDTASPVLQTIFTANGTDAYAIQYYSTIARATDGLGLAINLSGITETYTTVILRKIG